MITYKKAAACDIEQLYRLCKQLIDDYEDIDSIDYDKVLGWVRRKLESSIGEYTAIYSEHEKVGYYHFYKNENGEYELDDLYILPEYRDRGIGSEVIKKCCSSVAAPVMLYVFVKNKRAIALYQRLGFKIIRTVNGSRYIMRREADAMGKDMCVPCGEGLLNIRVGAIIMKDGKILMVGNERADYLYSVGGRIKLGETAEEAIVREVMEETGVKLEIDRLGFVHENYFYGDAPTNLGKLIYEISFFFYMKVPGDFSPISESFADGGSREFLNWVSLDDSIKLYPEFFKTELKQPTYAVKHFITDDRARQQGER